MTLTENFMYSGPDHPGEFTLLPPSLNKYKRNPQWEFVNASVDAATNIMIGSIVYLTAGTQANDMTAVAGAYGSGTEGIIGVVQPDGHSNYFAYSTTFLTNVMPNASSTASNYQYPAEAKIKVAILEPGDYVWVTGSQNGSFDTVFGYKYILAAGGLIAAPGAATTSEDTAGHTFTSIATTTNQNWALVRYNGLGMYDAS